MRNIMLKRSFVLALFALALLTAACAARQPLRGQETDGLDRKLSTFAFIEEGDLVTFIVGTRATRYREKSAYMPLEICIGNNGLKQLTLTRESFVLIDEEGNRYPAANPRELMESYQFLDLDRTSLSELDDIVFNKFAAYTRYGSKFSPTHMASTGRSNLVRDLVSLPKFGYIIDFIYFPAPATGLKGHRFELFMESQELAEPVFLKFIVE
jgi:hypothetical protein